MCRRLPKFGTKVNYRYACYLSYLCDKSHISEVAFEFAVKVRQTGAMTDWLTVPDLVELMQLSPSRIRRMMEERILPATRQDGVLKVPALFIRDGQPVAELHGTAIVLADAGFSDDEIVSWLIEPDDSVGDTPIAALRAGRKSLVRRVAQGL